MKKKIIKDYELVVSALKTNIKNYSESYGPNIKKWINQLCVSLLDTCKNKLVALALLSMYEAGVDDNVIESGRNYIKDCAEKVAYKKMSEFFDTVDKIEDLLGFIQNYEYKKRFVIDGRDIECVTDSLPLDRDVKLQEAFNKVRGLVDSIKI